MAKAITWAIRITFANARGRSVFLREEGVIGRGSITTFRWKTQADEAAAVLRGMLGAGDRVAVIERSHGRQAVAAKEPQ